MPSWISSLIVPYVFQALQGLEASIKWESVVAAVNGLLASAQLPAWLIAILSPFVAKVVAVFQAALADDADEKALITDAAAGNYAKALLDLEALIVKAYQGGVSSLLGCPVAQSVAAACGELAKHAPAAPAA